MEVIALFNTQILKLKNHILCLAFMVCLIAVISCGSISSYALEIQETPTGASYLSSIRTYYMTNQIDKAYSMTLEALSAVDPSIDANKTHYLELLTYAAYIESNYAIYDEMMHHAIELYQLSDSEEYAPYRMNALYILSYYDYTTYNNTRMEEKLNEMLLLPVDEQHHPKMIYYYRNLALLAMDNHAVDDAIQYYEKAYELSNIIPVDYSPDLPAVVLYDLASAYESKGDYKIALTLLSEAIDITDSYNSDLLFPYKLRLAYYYYQTGEYELAKVELLEADQLFEKTSKLYQTEFGNSEYHQIFALIAYAQKDYEVASQHFYEYMTAELPADSTQTTLNASKAASEFQLSSIKEQLNLLESFQNAKRQTVLFSAIAIILFITLSTIGLLYLKRKKMHQKRIYTLLKTDPLTQLKNRKSILESLNDLSKSSICIVLVEINHLKKLNFAVGETFGDEVIQYVAHLLQSLDEPDSLVGRYSGDTFLVILPYSAITSTTIKFKQLQAELYHHDWSQPNFQITTSIGIVFGPTTDTRLLLSEVDACLSRANDKGGNCIESSHLM